MLKTMRVEILVAIIAFAVIVHAAIVQLGAIKLAEIDGRNDVAIAREMKEPGKRTLTVRFDRRVVHSVEEKVPDASPALNTIAGREAPAKPTQPRRVDH